MKGASDKVADSRMERWDYSFTRDSLHPKDESHRSNFSLFFFTIFLTTKSKVSRKTQISCSFTHLSQKKLEAQWYRISIKYIVIDNAEKRFCLWWWATLLKRLPWQGTFSTHLTGTCFFSAFFHHSWDVPLSPTSTD